MTKSQLVDLQKTLLTADAEGKYVEKRRRLLVVLAVAYGELPLQDADAVARADADDKRVLRLDKMKLPSSLDGLGVMQTLARVTAQTITSLVNNCSTIEKCMPKPAKRLGVVDAIAAVRGRQFEQVTSHMSTSKLERKLERVISRARCCSSVGRRNQT